MLKKGLYVAESNDNYLDAYIVKMNVKETEKSYVFELVDFKSRYSATHLEMLFKNSNRVLLNKQKGGHAMRVWSDEDFTFYPYQAGIPYYFRLMEKTETEKQ